MMRGPKIKHLTTLKLTETYVEERRTYRAKVEKIEYLVVLVDMKL